MKFSIKDFFSKFDQIRRKLRIWSHLLKKSLMENFIFCVVYNNKFGIADSNQITGRSSKIQMIFIFYLETYFSLLMLF